MPSVGDRKDIRPVKTSASKPLGMVVNIKWVGYSLKYLVDMTSLGLSCEDARDKYDWKLRITGATG